MKKILTLIFSKKHILLYALLIVIMLASALASIGATHITVSIVDRLTEDLVFKALIAELSLYFCISVLNAVLQYSQAVLAEYLNQCAGIALKNHLVDCLFSKPLRYLSEKKIGEMQQILMSDTMSVIVFFMETVVSVFSNVFSAVAAIIYLAYLQWDLLIAILLLQPLMLLVQSVFGSRIYRAADEHRDALGEVISFSQELLSNLVQYIALGLRGFCLQKNSGILNACARKSVRSTGITTLGGKSISFVSSLIFVVIFGFGGYKVSVGTMTIGMLIGFVQFSSNLLGPLLELSNIRIEYEEIRPSLDRICEISDSESCHFGDTCTGIMGDLEFQDVSFSYTEHESVLNRVSLRFETGRSYCIIGKSGSGKTTLCNLILRLCQPQSGTILFDGIPINEFAESYFRSSITYVAQIPFVFNGTIRENICLDRELSEQELADAIAFAGLTEELRQFEDGYDHKTEDCGGNLSVGQRQRIGLARAFARNTPIVIFDEPTASIGQEHTQWFIEQIDWYKKDRLVIIISHDEDVAARCDVVYKITAQGSLEEINR